MEPRHLAIFVPSLAGGGTEKVMATLAKGFSLKGNRVDLLLAHGEGPNRDLISTNIRVLDFGKKGVFGCIPQLTRYLRTERPFALYSALSHANVVALISNFLAGSPTRMVVSERSSFVEAKRYYRSMRDRVVRLLMRLTYPRAEFVVVVAEAMVDELHLGLGIDRDKLVAIRNPVVGADLLSAARSDPDNPLFHRGRPVIVAAGRLTFEKDFDTLIRAFAIVHHRCDAGLLIMGEGPERARLEALVEQLGLEEVVSLPGFVANPIAAMRAADLFVLSSLLEGMPGVMVQAMACGTPVVSTDCRTGPREILENGRWGRLVPVGDAVQLAGGIIASLESRSHPDVKLRAADFDTDRSVQQYLDLSEGSVGPP